MLHYRLVRPGVNGDDLRRLGLPPSQQYRLILQALRQAWLDGEITTPEEEQNFLQRLITQNEDGNS
jgi:hypothetical protein